MAWICLLALAGVGVGWASGSWRQWAMPGKLHRVHSTFEDNCAACHMPLQPTTSANGLQSLLGTGPVADHLCQSCHEGPAHHPHRTISGEVGTCSSCHRDHQGRNSTLSQAPDRDCLACHQDLKSKVVDGQPRYENMITHFSGHPSFRIGSGTERTPLSAARDPGNLKFNHKLHLAPGQATPDSRRGRTLADIADPELREWYRQGKSQDGKSDTDLVQLDCASCHQSDAQDQFHGGNSIATQRRMPGDYMLPIEFNQHCKACHPLTLGGPLATKTEIPHPLKPQEVEAFVWGTLAKGAVSPKSAGARGDWPLPGGNQPRPQSEPKRWIDEAVRDLNSQLYQEWKGPQKDQATSLLFAGNHTCGLCHIANPTSGDPRAPRTLKPTQVQEMWLPHGGFHHVYHRGVACTDCHQQAVGSTQSSEILLPDVENCQKCHGPSKTVAGHHQGGVPHTCTSCHKYHNGDQPRAGPGAAARAPKRPKSLQDFLDDR